MTINSIRSDCPVDLLSWYVNGTLSAEDQKVVESHLAICVYCRADVVELRGLHGAFQRAAIVSPQPSRDLLAQLEPKLYIPKVDYKDATRENLMFLWQLLRAQVPLIRRDLWAASALVLIIGWVISFLLSAHRATPDVAVLAVIAPLIAALGLSVVYGPENDVGLEWAMTSQTSPRQVLLCRFVLVFGYNLALTLVLFGVFKLAIPGFDVSVMLDLWLGPMFFLSGVSLLLSLAIGVNASVTGSLVLWTLRVIALMPTDARFATLQSLSVFWASTPILLVLAAAFLIVGFTLVKKEEIFL